MLSPEETTAMLRSEGAKEKQHHAEPVATVTTKTVTLPSCLRVSCQSLPLAETDRKQ